MNGTASNIPVDVSNAGVFARLTDRARRVINQAHKDAEKLNHAMVYSDMLLQAIARESGSVAWAALQNLELLEHVLTHKPKNALMAGPPPYLMPLFHDVKSALENAGKIATAIGHPYIGTEHILLGLLEQPHCVAVEIMAKHVKPETIRNEVLDLLGCADPKEKPMPEEIKLGSRVQNRLYPHIQGTVVAITTYLYGTAEIRVSSSVDFRIQEYTGPIEAFALLSNPNKG